LERKLLFETTADGSLTLYVPDLDEHYHSINGAIREAEHVYLEAGFRYRTTCCYGRKDCSSGLHVLEMGFGTGLNAFLTALEAVKLKTAVFYTALEKFPLLQQITNQLNYSKIDESLFRNIHESKWEIPTSITPYFTLKKINIDFLNFNFRGKYDVIYYDAFAPDKQPEVWSQNLFDKLFSAANPGCVLVTYCAKGIIRRRMQHAGFTVQRIPGPPGKREMLRANVLPNSGSDEKKHE
jgi:tRNA U34 5-methylaminomethyl-2-thiouridine-forming methyltransferase MnmC